jgi:hypothetical protein
MMPLSNEAKDCFFSHQGIPLVGLIHRNTKDIVFAPCIPQKVNLTLNPEGEVVSGMFIDDLGEEYQDVTAEDLTRFNQLLKIGYVPRLASVSAFDVRSSHEFLFEQQCKFTKQAEWGGFSVIRDSSSELNYAFASGAFNSLSQSKKRQKGAQLSEDLIVDVKKQMTELVGRKQNTEIDEDVFSSLQTQGSVHSPECFVTTPPPKHRGVETNHTRHDGPLSLGYGGLFFSASQSSTRVDMDSSTSKTPNG